MRAEQGQCAEGVRHVPRGFGAPLAWQRFGKHEEAIKRIDQAERGRGPERGAKIGVTEITADRWPNDEAKPKSGTDVPKGLGTLFRRSDVRNIGIRGRNVGGRYAGDDAANKQPSERWSPSHHDVVDAQPEAGEKNDGAAAKAVGPRAQNRRKKELHHVPDQQEVPGEIRRAAKVSTLKLTNEIRQHRRDDAERQHIERHHDQDKNKGSATGTGSARQDWR